MSPAGGGAYASSVYFDSTGKIPMGSGWLIDPHSLALDASGNLYATYYNGLKILRIAPGAASYAVFPGGGTGDDADNGIAVDAAGGLYTVVNGGRTTSKRSRHCT